jgi:hypothetical protein
MTVMHASFDSDLDRYRITGGRAGSPTVRVDLERFVTAWFALTGELAELAIDSADTQTIDGVGVHDADTRHIVDSLCGRGALEVLLARHRTTSIGPDGSVELGELHVDDEALEQQQQVARAAWAHSNPAATARPADSDQSALPRGAETATAQAITVWSGDDLAAVVDAVEHSTGAIAEQPADISEGQLVRVGIVHVHITDSIPDGVSLIEPAHIAWQPDSGRLDIQIARSKAHTRIPDGWWIRVSTTAGDTIALAPLEPGAGAHTLLATHDDTLDGTVIDLTANPTRSVGGPDDRIRARLARLAAIALEAEHDDDSATAGYAWQAAAHVATEHGDTELAEHLHARAQQHHDDPTPRPPRARNVAPGHRDDIARTQRQRSRRQLIVVASVVVISILAAAAAVWAFAANDDIDAPINTSDAASTPDVASDDRVPNATDSTEPVATEPVATDPVVVVDNDTAEYSVGDPTPFTGLRERIVLTVQTPTLTADQPLQVQVAYARTTPGDPWAPGASLTNCLNNVGQVLNGDVNSPAAARTQLTTGYRVASAENGTDDLDQYNEPDGGWVPLTVTTPTSQLTVAAATSAVIGCLPPSDPPVGEPEFADRVRVAYEHRYQPITVDLDVTALTPGTYTLVPVLVNGIPTAVNPELVTFTITED